MAKKSERGGRKGKIIGKYTLKSGKKLKLREYTPKQKKTVKRKKDRWSEIPPKKLEQQAVLMIVLGIFFAVMFYLMTVAGAIMLITAPLYGIRIAEMNSLTLYLGIIVIVVGLIFTIVSRSVVSSGMARLKWMTLHPEKKKELSETDLNAIAERFLSGL